MKDFQSVVLSSKFGGKDLRLSPPIPNDADFFCQALLSVKGGLEKKTSISSWRAKKIYTISYGSPFVSHRLMTAIRQLQLASFPILFPSLFSSLKGMEWNRFCSNNNNSSPRRQDPEFQWREADNDDPDRWGGESSWVALAWKTKNSQVYSILVSCKIMRKQRSPKVA